LAEVYITMPYKDFKFKNIKFEILIWNKQVWIHKYIKMFGGFSKFSILDNLTFN